MAAAMQLAPMPLLPGDLVVVQMDHHGGDYYWPGVINFEMDDGSFRVVFLQNRPTHDDIDISRIRFYCRDVAGPTAFHSLQLIGQFEESNGQRPMDLCWLRSIERLEEFRLIHPTGRVAEVDRRAAVFNQVELDSRVDNNRRRYCTCETEMNIRTTRSTSLMAECQDCKLWFHLTCLTEMLTDEDGRQHEPDVRSYVKLTAANRHSWAPWYCPACISWEVDGLPDGAEIHPAGTYRRRHRWMNI